MNFFETELRKIAGVQFPEATYIGQACYVPLNDQLRAKLQFVTCGYADNYEAIHVTILNRRSGKIDESCLHFRDLLGTKSVSNPNFPQGICPHIWVDAERPRWYLYQPTSKDYALLGQTIQDYLNVFQEPRQTETHVQEFQQSMQ